MSSIINAPVSNRWTALQLGPASEAVLRNLTEGELAQLRRRERSRVICHVGRFWKSVRPGFYQPLNVLAKLESQEATPPTPWCWGFRAATRREECNGSIPVHLLENLDGFSLTSKRRAQVRRCRQSVEFVELLGPVFLQRAGWHVYNSSMKRVGFREALPSLDTYNSEASRIVAPEQRLVLAGLVRDDLAGYLVCHAVDGTAYLEKSYHATEYLPLHISLGLLCELIDICKRSPGIKRVVRGLHSREMPGLTKYKESLGFPVHQIPAKVYMHPVLRRVVRRRNPHVYYRLTGTDSLSL